MKTNSLTRALAMGVGSAAVLGSVMLLPHSAWAEASGCTGSNLRSDPVMLCIGVWGDSTRVDRINTSIDIINPKGYTCNGEFKVWGTYKNGEAYSDTKHAKCGYLRVWVDFKPKHKQFKPGTKVCGALVEYGEVRHEHACIEIKE